MDPALGGQTRYPHSVGPMSLFSRARTPSTPRTRGTIDNLKPLILVCEHQRNAAEVELTSNVEPAFDPNEIADLAEAIGTEPAAWQQHISLGVWATQVAAERVTAATTVPANDAMAQVRRQSELLFNYVTAQFVIKFTEQVAEQIAEGVTGSQQPDLRAAMHPSLEAMNAVRNQARGGEANRYGQLARDMFHVVKKSIAYEMNRNPANIGIDEAAVVVTLAKTQHDLTLRPTQHIGR